MATKEFKTRIQLRYDNNTAWGSTGTTGKGANTVLNVGEVAFNKIDNNVVMVKVGDGVTKFADLPYLSAYAGDVYAWAKAPAAPTAGAISGLSAYINSNAPIRTITLGDCAAGIIINDDTANPITFNFASPSQGTKADNAMPKAGGTFTGNVTMSSGKTLTVNTPTASGHAATKGYVDSAVAGLSGAMHFRGTSTTVPTSSGATVSGVTSFNAGDVVLNSNKEYVYTGTSGNAAASWKELGDESSYVPKTRKVNGKALSADVTLTATDVGAVSTSQLNAVLSNLEVCNTAEDASTGNYVYFAGVNNTGELVTYSTSMPTALRNPNAITIGSTSYNGATAVSIQSLKSPFGLTFGSKTYDGSAAKSITAADLGAITGAILATGTTGFPVISIGVTSGNIEYECGSINITTHVHQSTNDYLILNGGNATSAW